MSAAKFLALAALLVLCLSVAVDAQYYYPSYASYYGGYGGYAGYGYGGYGSYYGYPSYYGYYGKREAGFGPQQ